MGWGGRGWRGSAAGLTSVGEREALSMPSGVAAEGEQQRRSAQAQRPWRRWMGAVEGAE